MHVIWTCVEFEAPDAVSYCVGVIARCAKRNAPDVEERATTTLQSHKCFGIQRNTKANAKILWWPVAAGRCIEFIHATYCDDSVSFAWTPRT